MPIYEYQCGSCGATVELIHSVNAKTPPTHQCCGLPKLKRVLSNTSFQLKGGGWYKDGYSKKEK